MDYSAAKIEAISLTYARRMDHAILFDGKNYSVSIRSLVVGEPFETVKYIYKKPSKVQDEKPIQQKPVKKTGKRKPV